MRGGAKVVRRNGAGLVSFVKFTRCKVVHFISAGLCFPK